MENPFGTPGLLKVDKVILLRRICSPRKGKPTLIGYM
jgi:hypothetical protein